MFLKKLDFSHILKFNFHKNFLFFSTNNFLKLMKKKNFFFFFHQFSFKRYFNVFFKRFILGNKHFFFYYNKAYFLRKNL